MQEIKDPVSGASITLPRLNGLTVNEVLFAQWAVTNYPFMAANELSFSLGPDSVLHMAEFCHQFLCLRMGLADWGDGALIFPGEPLTAKDSLTMTTADGQKRSAPMNILFLLYGFWCDEQRAWLSGKTEGAMLRTIQQAIAPLQIGMTSTGVSSENTPDTTDLQGEILGDAPPMSLKARSKVPRKAA